MFFSYYTFFLYPVGKGRPLDVVWTSALRPSVPPNFGTSIGRPLDVYFGRPKRTYVRRSDDVPIEDSFGRP